MFYVEECILLVHLKPDLSQIYKEVKASVETATSSVTSALRNSQLVSK